MNTINHRRRLWALASGVLLSFSSLVAAEPPSRAARLGYLSGTVSFSPAGQPDWVHAAVNRPLTTGDRLWTGGSSRAELQIGGAAIRMGPSTSMDLLNLNNRIAQVQLAQGTLKIRVRSLGPRQTFEVATPNLAFTLRRPGDYRIEVDPNDDATTVMVRNGEAEVYGQGASYTVNSRRTYRFYGTDLSDYETLAAQRDDDLDRWSRERDRRGDRSVSARYVSSDVVGYEDLDANGSWRVDATYGSVWTPTRVASGWTPYRDGHWSWVDPWGWTWVDDAPWGYAVSHYGRWANINNTWAWVPGPRREQAVYAPALVAFVGGKNFQVSVSVGGTSAANVGWFPLAPREVYQPSYPVSRSYFDSINRSNTVVAPTMIANVYNTTIVSNTTNVTNLVYANQQVTGAVVAVPTQAFVQSQPVAKATVQLPRDAVISAPVLRVASVAPVRQSVQGGAREAAAKPPTQVQAVVARTAPPPAPLPFAAQQPQLAAKPGTPIDEAQRAQIKPAAPAVVAPKISVLASAPPPTATALPPATPPAAKSPEARKAAAAIAAGGSGDGRRPDANNAAGATAGTVRAEAARTEPAKIEASKTEAAPIDAAKAAGAKADEAKAAAAKAETVKAVATKAEALKAEAVRAAAEQAEAARAGATQAAAAKAEAAKAAASSADASKAAETKADAARVRADAAKAADAKAEASKAGEVRAEQVRGDAAKAEAMKVEAARAAAAQAEAAKAGAAQAAAANAAKAEAAKAAASRADAAKAAETKADAARADVVRADAAKAANARAEAVQAEAAKAGEARAERARGDAAKAEGIKAEAARVEAAKAEANRADAAKSAIAKAETAKADSARADASKAEAAHAAAAKKPPAAAPESPASGPKADTDATPEGEKTKKNGRKP